MSRIATTVVFAHLQTTFAHARRMTLNFCAMHGVESVISLLVSRSFRLLLSAQFFCRYGWSRATSKPRVRLP